MDSSHAGEVSGVCWLPVDPHGKDTYVMECLRLGWGRENEKENMSVRKTE